jgi:Tfp pilus assembly protein PilN
MKLFDPTKLIFGNRSLTKPSGGRTVIVHWDRENVHFFVTASNAKRVLQKEFGTISYAAPDNPFAALANHFASQDIHASRLVALLSRPELDLIAINLPPADESEIASLVASEVEQQLGESPEPPVIDYYVAKDSKESGSGGNQVLAFALNRRELDSIRSQSEAVGFRLQAIGSRHLGPLSLLRKQKPAGDTLVVAIHLYPGETELTICLGDEPILLRSIRNSTDDADRVAEQIALESQRCFTLLPQSIAELPKAWCLFATGEVASKVASALSNYEEISLTSIDPFVGLEVERSVDEESGQSRYTSAANIGAASDYLSQSLPVNLLSPKRPPAPQNPWRRWGGLGLLTGAAAAFAGYMLLSDVWQLQTEADDLEAELSAATKLTAKYMEKSDQVQAVEAWLADQVDWLAELSELSNRLPDGSDASVRRLSASASGKGASIDISVEANSQETISQLENRIRGAKYSAVSKQISQNADSEEYPWRFETQISFELEPPRPKLFGPPEPPSDQPSKETTDQPSSEGSQ